MLIDELLKAIQEETSGEIAYSFVKSISGYHRIQASPGFREAAGFVQDSLVSVGLQTQTHSYPAREGVKFWTQSSFPEWDCQDAELVLLHEGRRVRLASYLEDKISLIQRSSSTPKQGVTTQLVYIENASCEDSYRDTDVRGKLVFSRGDAGRIARCAVDKMGALGIVVDNMNEFPPVRQRHDVPDARQYTSFWPERVSAHKALGFVVTPRQGDMLRSLLSRNSNRLDVYVRIVSRFYEGTMEVVDASIDGELEEEVTGIAHLCHPQPSANDNASGAGALMEAARALSALVESGRLPKPKRTLRFLFLPEMTGSYAYLSQKAEALSRTVAAINLDMVGENQDLCKGPFVIERPPRATPGAGGDLAESILRRLTQEVPNLAGTSSYALFKWAVAPFSGGSDHYIWADPTVGVTCPMLIQWPDKYYHTNQDTIDKVDPNMLRLAATLTAAYMYFLACAGPEEAYFLAQEAASNFSNEVYGAFLGLKDYQRGRERLLFLRDRKKQDILWLRRFLEPGSCQRPLEAAMGKVDRETEFYLQRLGNVQPAHGEEDPASLVKEALSTVPVRTYLGPVSVRSLTSLSPDLENQWERFFAKWDKNVGSLTTFVYWLDGKRSVMEARNLTQNERGESVNLEMVLQYIHLLERSSLLQIKNVS